jgi:hypothetical protein
MLVRQMKWPPLAGRTPCRTAALHENNFADLDAKYADVVDFDEAVERRRAGFAAGGVGSW